jgi:hypothetical protein
MDEHRTRFFYFLCFTWPYLERKKIETSPSFTTKHRNSTRRKKNEKE